MMDEMTDVNWQSEIREMVEDLVRAKKKQRFLAEVRKLRQRMKRIILQWRTRSLSMTRFS